MKPKTYIVGSMEKPTQSERFDLEDIVFLDTDLDEADAFQKDDKLLVFCETTGFGEIQVTPSLPGIEFVKKCRLKGFRGHCLFVSFLSLPFILDLSSSNEIVKTIGHSFMRMPFNFNNAIKALKKENSLSAIELVDIQTNYCTRFGIAQHELHQLHTALDNKENSSEKTKEVVDKTIRSVAELCEIDPRPLLNKIESLGLREGIKEVESNFAKVLTEDIAIGIDSLTERVYPWSVLILDDEIPEDHSLIIELKKRVKHCELYRTAQQALSALQSEKYRNQFALVISDYRLEHVKNGIQVHQPIQGYTFLQQVKKLNPNINMVALSSLPRKFLLHSLRGMGLNINVFSKKDYLDNESFRQMLVDDLLELGEEANDAMIRVPMLSSPKWEYYVPFYAHHRNNSRDYGKNENYISQKAKEYCLNYKEGLYLGALSGYTSELKGARKTPENPTAYNEFLEKMVCRRVIIWASTMLFGHLEGSPIRLWPVLKGLPINGTEVNESTAKNQINTNLALKLTDFPWNMTVEERNWLYYDMGYGGEKAKLLERKEFELMAKLKVYLVKDMNIANKVDDITTLNESKSVINSELINSTLEIDQTLNFFKKVEKEIFTIGQSIDISKSHGLSSFSRYVNRTIRYLRVRKNQARSGEPIVDLDKAFNYVYKEAQKIISADSFFYDDIFTEAYDFCYSMKSKGEVFRDNEQLLQNFIKHFRKNVEGDTFGTRSIEGLSFEPRIEDDDLNEESDDKKGSSKDDEQDPGIDNDSTAED